MTPEQQRIAIAEAIPRLRWEIVSDYSERWVWPSGIVTGPPDDDLNAMHEAVKILPDELRHLYRVNLCLASNKIHPNNVRKLSKEQQDQAYWQYCNATAAQRAEAFLRALNLWKEN